jgi:hypothetical protein
MRTWWTARRGQRPSAALVVAFAALMVALGGTAYAATTIVNIADPTTPAYKAKVDATGALRTTATVSGVVGATIPRTPVWSGVGLTLDHPATIIGANKATVAITRAELSNFWDQTGPVSAILVQEGGNATTCDSSGAGQKSVAAYDVKVGETFGESFGTPLVLKPLTAGSVWCLVAYLSIEGSTASSYYEPQFSWSGYVAAGTLPPSAIPAGKARPESERVG